MIDRFTFSIPQLSPEMERRAYVCLPEGYELVCMLPIGVPAEKPSAPKKKEFRERAWFNSFGCGAENGEA